MNRKHHTVTSGILVMMITLLATLAWAQKNLEIPTGATIRVRVIDRLSSEESQTGDTFHGTLDEPIEVNDKVLFPKGSDVMGRVTDAHRTGRLSEPGELDLVLVTISSGSVAESVHVEPLVIKGESHTKSNATKIGGGAALGAIIGGIAGGGKGAAIGTIAGAGAGTGAAAATGKKPALVDPEAVLTFTTSAPGSPTTPLPSSGENRGEIPNKAPEARPARDSASEREAPPDSAPSSADDTPLFTLRDRRIIRNCVNDHAADFPAGAIERPELPPGSERQLRRGETLSPDVQRQVQSLPLACEDQLPKLSGDLERVVYSGKVLLIDNRSRILDMFNLDASR
jgi:hypothetical protein